MVINEREHLIYVNPAAADTIGTPLRRIKIGADFKEHFKFSSSVWDGDLQSVKSSTPYREMSLGSIGLPDSVVQVSIQPIDEGQVEDPHWIIYIKNLTLEAKLQSKYMTEKELKSKAQEAATKDSLTQIYNKGALLERIAGLSDAVRKNGCCYTLIFFDLDNFKSINDRYGHQAGDAVLSEMTQMINYRMLREGDFFARFGGEEFVIILNRCGLENGIKVAERIRQSIEGHDFIYQGVKLPVTISIGVGEYNQSTGTPEEFFKKVDEAAYASKKKGKNAITVV